MTTITPQVAVVDFHHARGPEIEFWVHSDGENLYKLNDWSLLPFMALSDGAHAMAEEFSYFTLLDNRSPDADPVVTPLLSAEAKPRETGAVTSAATSLFGISCTRQIRSEKLKRRSVDVTRSTVQKAVVVISPTARGMGELRERLGIVTAAWFAQEDFSDISILKEFQDSLVRAPPTHEDGKDHNFGLSLREMIYEFRHQTLALVKCLLLQRKMLFFGSKCERLCMMQFALISLIPGLIANLQDAADPSLDNYAQKAQKATSLRTGDRSSLLAFMGLPLQLFGKGSIFGPYTPLQQLDILADYDTKSYVVGSTNSLLLQQKEKYSDILINLDESNSMTVTSPSLRAALALSAADRRWIDYLTQTVLDTWDPENPSRPKNMGYAGSEDAIRMQFEEYILSLLSSMAYQIYHETVSESGIPASVANIENFPEPGDTATDFNPEFLAMWRTTNNFALFDRLTRGNRIFDIIEPRHPTGGGLTVEDLQRRVARGMAELHLDEKVREGREQLGRTLQSGRERVEAGMARFWAELEKAREQRAQQRATKTTSGSHGTARTSGEGEQHQDLATKPSAVALSSASSNSSWMVVETEGEPGTGSAPLKTTPRPVSPPSSSSTTGPSTSTGAAGGSNWTASLRDRAPRVDASQIQASAREGAARAGAYLSGWGTWARERIQQQNQQNQQNQQQQAKGTPSSQTPSQTQSTPGPSEAGDAGGGGGGG
ncbi:Late secretory pathway protein AVL9 [Fonsecaea pedrosoi]|nr:Late secretory pathway protein AVL9 [Fonsecaea pedrosoi]